MSLIINDKKVAGLYKAYVIQNATNTASGIIRIATEDEVKAGIDSLTAVTPKHLATKQDVLIAGEGLEILEDGTINNTQTSAEWGNVIGNILDQEDLTTILLTKANVDETAYELTYEDSVLTLKNKNGDVLSSIELNEIPDVDGHTIEINDYEQLQVTGIKTKSGTFKYTWIGTEEEYADAKDLGVIDEFTECIIVDSEAEKVVPIVQYTAPTKLSELANDIYIASVDELQDLKDELEAEIELKTDGANIVHKTGNETIDGFKEFKQKIVIQNGLDKGRIAHKPLNSSLEDGYIEFGDNTLLYGKQNIQGELYDEKHDIFHAGNLVAGNNITITEKDGVYKINGQAGGGTGGGSIDNVDNETIIIQDDGSISAQGVLDQNAEDLTAIKFWSGTLEEYEALGEWDDNTLYNITDDMTQSESGGGTGGLTELPIASTNTLGGVKVDGNTINVTQEGVISANIIKSYNDLTDKPTIPSAYTLPTASTDTLGGVKVDGETISILNGVISAINAGGSGEWEVSVNATGWYAKHMSSGLIIQGLLSAWSSTEGKGSFSRTFTFKTPFKTKVLFSWSQGTISNGMYGYIAPTLTLTNVTYTYAQTANSSYSEELILVGY